MLDFRALVLRRGSQARTVLDDEVFREAVNSLKARYIDANFQTKLGQQEQRENCYRAVRLIDEIVDQLQTYVSEASYEEKQTLNQG